MARVYIGGGTGDVEVPTGGDGGVTDVTATAPITSTGGTTPNIAIDPATETAAGSMSAADKIKLDGLPTPPIPSSIVFRPGYVGPALPNVFTTEAALAAATQALNGAAYTLFWDLSLIPGAYFFATVGQLDLAPNGTWTDGGNAYIIAFTKGTTIANLPVLVTGQLRIVSEQAQPIFTGSQYPFFMAFEGISNFQSNQGAFISVINGGFYVVTMRDESYMEGFAVDPAMLTCDATSTIEVYLQDGTGLYSTAVVAAPGGTAIVFNYSPDTYIYPTLYPIVFADGLFIDYDGGATAAIPPARSHGGIIFEAPTGILYWSNASAWVPLDAGGFSYAPAVIANWSGTAPTSVANALDRIAAHVGPIPT